MGLIIYATRHHQNVSSCWPSGKKAEDAAFNPPPRQRRSGGKFPRGRLCVPCGEAGKYNLLMAGLERLREVSIDRAKESALWAVGTPGRGEHLVRSTMHNLTAALDPS